MTIDRSDSNSAENHCRCFQAYVKVFIRNEGTSLHSKGMALSLNDLQQIKRTLKRAPPPRPPSGVPSAENGATPTDTGTVSVASFRNRFEQKQTPSPKSPTGSSPCQDGGQPSEEGVISVASAKAMFEQKPLKKPPPPRKQVNGNQTKSGSSPYVDKNSNVNNFKREPTRKELPPFFRIGAAPFKPAKPDYLKSKLRRFQDQIVLANGTTTVSRTTSKEKEEFEETEDTYDDVASVNQDNQSDDTYECM